MKKLIKRSNFILYILLCIICFSCTLEPEKPPTKPFIITHKYPESAICNGGYCGYKYVDANGNIYTFCESVDAYMIGDTIK